MFNIFKTKYRWILGAIFLLILVLVFANFFEKLLTSDQRLDTKESGRAFLYSNGYASQLFTADKDRLSTVMIALGKVNLKAGEFISIQLADSSCNKVIAESRIDDKIAGSFDPYRFYFPELSDSAGQVFCLKVSFSGTKKKELYSPFVYLTKDSLYQSAETNNPGNIKFTSDQGVFSMKPLYGKLDLKQEIISLDQKISQYKPWFFKGNFLYVLSIIVLLSIVGLVIILVTL